jgi:hypothetical protein
VDIAQAALGTNFDPEQTSVPAAVTAEMR